MPDDAEQIDSIEGLRRERDFYRQLLDLGTHTELEPLLSAALQILIELAGARRGYVELRARDGSPGLQLERSSRGDTLVGDFSRSVVEQVLQTATTVLTASAHGDPRFRDKASVRSNKLEAVLCAPIGSSPVLGVTYLQDRVEGGAFTDHDRRRVELFTRHIAPFAERLVLRRTQQDARDATARARSALEVEEVIGRSAALASVLERVAAVAGFDVPVLLTGPSGTGKTQLAQVIHANSARAGGPFVEVSCANLPEALVENELFGAARGAHSTASKPSAGKIQAAAGGTLFFDEIGELPHAAQAKLLQVLQSRTYYALGSTRAERADVRVVVATNRDLEQAVKGGAFREDLYYRISTFPIRMPSLAERREDIPLLAKSLCASFCGRNQLPVMDISPALLETMQFMSWPGNVRELAGAIERAVILARSQGLLTVEAAHLSPEEAGDAVQDVSFASRVERYKRQVLLEALEAHGWNVTETARALQIARAHVYNLMQVLELKRP